MGRNNLTPEEKFWSHVSKKSGVRSKNPNYSGECWIWDATLDKDGYGRFFHKELNRGNGCRAHRYSYELNVGEIVESNDIHHNCYNKNCVNPDHLEQMSHGENMRQPDHFIGQQLLATHCPRNHCYDEYNTHIDEKKQTHRSCKICDSLRQRNKTAWASDKSAILTTWPSKTKIDVLYPNIESILLEDVCHHLANICRWSGACSDFYSVLDHSMQVSLIVKFLGGSQKDQLCGLLHDGSEYVCNDMPSPLKSHLRIYKSIEDLFQRVIANKFGLPYPFPHIVHEADILARKYEAHVLRGEELTIALPGFVVNDPSSPSERRADNKQLFMKKFYELGGGIR